MTGCEKYIQQMNRYLDGDLPASQISELLEHLDHCPSCRNRFDALKIIAFEMRHMQKQPPAALHDHIMGAVRRTPQKKSQFYLRTFGTLAACAALLVLTVQQGFFRTMGDYLFPQNGVYSGGVAGEDEEQKASGFSMEKSAGEEGASTPAGNSPQAALTEKDDPSTAVPSGKAAASQTPAEAPSPRNLEPSNGAEAATPEIPSAPSPDSSQTTPSSPNAESFAGIPSGSSSEDLSPVDASEQRADFHIPFLDTDEVFAFYCVATGPGELPNVFQENSIVRYPEKNCLYIYVSTRDFTQTGCENLLRLGGFTIHAPAGLPETDAGMPYGLVAIYQYQQS